MSLAVLSLLFTVGVLVHNAEEAVWLPRWSNSRWRAPVSSRQFLFAVSVFSVGLVLVALVALAAGPRTVPAYLFAGCVFAMVANVLIPHTLGSLALRSYIPGTATALLLNAPLGSTLLYRMVDEGFVELPVLSWFAPVVALGIAASIPALFWVAGWGRSAPTCDTAAHLDEV